MKKILTLFAFVFVVTFTKAQPVASVSPASISKTFNLCYDSQSDTVMIFNTGTSDLTYNLTKGYGINYDSTSSQNYSTSPASTFHGFYTVGTTSDSVFFTITLNGDYDNANEYSDLWVDGAFVTTLNDGNLPNGTDIVINLAYSGATVAGWLADGMLNVELRNQNTVGSFVGTELHRVRVRTSGASWTTVSSSSGTVVAGDSAIITVTFNGTNLGSGIYASSIRITTNDGGNPVFVIPTSMTINGYPEINLSSACIAFDTLQIFETQTKQVTISNTGCDPLIISSMTKSLTQYSLDTASATLQPGDFITLNVTFSPTTLGDFIDTVRIFNSATDTFVCLTGTAVNKPLMTISPKTMNVTLNSCNDSSTVQLKIKNTGANNLVVNSISPEVSSIGNPIAPTCSPSGTKNNCCGMGIFNVSFNAINYTTLETDGRYNDYSSTEKTFVSPGQTYSFYVRTGTTYTEYVRAWIDYNNNGDFNDAGEQVFADVNFINHSGNITIPNSVSAGQPLRMRVASDYNFSAVPQPCSNADYGQTEDYTIYILGGLEIQFSQDTIAAGDSSLVNFVFKSQGLVNGVYTSTVIVSGNDPLNLTDTVLTTLTINGSADLTFSNNCIAFDTVMEFLSNTKKLMAYNNGCDTLIVSSITNVNSIFSLDTTSFTLVPFDSIMLTATFSPVNSGTYTDTFSFASNVGTKKVCLSGTATESPFISTNTDSLAATLTSCNDSLTIPLTIYNTGAVDLILNISTASQQLLPASCTPITTGYCCNMGIYNVSFNTINNNSTNGSVGYQDFTATKSTNVMRGQSYTLSVTTGTSYNENVRAWIDFNNNGIFESSEQVFESLNTYVNHSGNITIPISASAGSLRMRVGSDYAPNAAPQPCTNVQYGQFEDYSVVIQSGVSLPVQTIVNTDTIPVTADSCSASGAKSNCCGMGIFNVTFNSINNTTVETDGRYNDYSATQTALVAHGQSYPITITTGVTYNEHVRVWIDYNDNGSFEDAGEKVFESLNVRTTHSGNITISGNAVDGRNLRMRVGSEYASNPAPDPCTNVTYGQFEDYTVFIQPKDRIVSGDSMTVNIIFEAENLVSGVYTNFVTITSNDPQNPIVTIPVTLTLNGNPDLVLSANCLNLDSIMQYTSSTDTFKIYNTGCDSLRIDSITNNLSVFTKNINAINLASGDSIAVVVTFSPIINGTFRDTLRIYNNDNDTFVCLLGKSFLSPLMTVTPKNLSATLSGCNDTINRTFKIKNTGSSPLSYMLDGDIGYNVTSTQFMTTTGQQTDHVFTNIGQTDSILLTIKLNGNYQASFESADLYIDNNFIETIPDGDIANGLEVVVTRVYTASQIAPWLSDDSLLVSILNNGNVNPGFGDDLNQVNVRANGLAWLNSVSSTSGTINVNDSVFITTTFRASGLVSGVYTGKFFVNNNDPFNPADTVNCTLTLTGAPSIALSATCLDLDSIMQFTSNTKSLTIYNNGCDTLNVTSMSNALSVYTVDTTVFEVMPFDSLVINVTFSPISAGSFLDSLRIFNNDVNKVVCLTGDAFPRPIISTNPDSFNVVLNGCNDSTTRNLTVYNTGGSNLTFATNENGAGSSYDSTITIVYSISDATTIHTFANLPYNDSLYLTITLNGDYDSGSEYAEVYVDGTYIELIPDADPGNGTNIIRNYAFGGSQVNTWLADGQVNVTIDNSNQVDAFVGTEIHSAQVRIPGVSWMETTPAQDTTAASDSSVLVLKFSSVGVTAGTHTGILFINSNDPLNPVIQIPLVLTVSGNPVLSVSQNCLAHDTIMELTSSVKNFTISNTGCDTLFITGATTNTAFFSADATGFFVAPLSSANPPITFAPNAAGNFADSLHIQTNDIDTVICLTGVAFGRPIISANPNPLVVTTNSCDDTTNAVVKIYNTGASNLNYNINQFFGTPLSPPCTPATLAYCCGNGIYNVTLNGMNFSSSDGADGYKDYSDSIGTILIPGNCYTLFVTTGDTNNERTKMWIDWNNDGVFSGGEWIMSNTNFLPNRVHSVFFCVPASAVKNVPLRMRIGTEDAENPDFFDCNDVTNGQFEDYSIIVMGISPTVGVVAPGDSASVTVPFISTNLPAGTYSGNLVISTNSPTQSEFTLPYTLNINGFASISLSDLCIDFDTTAVNATKMDTVTIYNNGGCDTLFVTSISTGTSEFANDVSSMTILPSDSAEVIISFTPTSVGNFLDTLFISSSAGDTTICLSGIATGAPVIVVIPDTLNGTVACGDSVTNSFKVKNIGIDTLNITINDTTTWANFSSLNGTLGPNDSMNISVEMNSTAMGTGFYSESAVITSNDISNPSLNLILNFTITAYPFAPAAMGASACELSPIPPLTASGTNIQWYADALHTTLVFAGDTFNTGQTLPGVYTYFVTQTVNGCESVDTSVALVISDASNTATSVSSSADSICNGNSTMLMVVGGSLGAGGNWVWYADSCGGSSIGMGDTITVSPTANTDYFVRAEDACGATACVSKTIIVNTSAPAPVALDTTTCGGGPVPPLTASGFAIKWYSDPGLTILLATGNTFNTGQTADGIYNYYVTQTLGGCESPADVATLIIGSSSTAAASINFNRDTICLGNSVTLTVNGGTLGTNAQWKWYSGSCGGTLVDSGTTITVSPAVSTNYFVRAEGICNTTSCVNKNIVVTGTAPSAPIALDTFACENAAIPNLTSTGTNVQWYFDAATTILLGSGNSFASGQTAPGTYNYFATQTVGGCESNPDTSTLVIYSISTAATSISAADDSICLGSSVLLSVNGGSLGSGANWNWYDAGCGNNLVGNGTSILVSPTVTTTYFVRAEGMCNTTVCRSKTITVISNVPAPTASDVNSCQGSVNSTLTATGNFVKWYDDAMLTNLVFSGNTYNTGISASGVYTFYATQTIGGCEGISDTVMLTINDTSTRATSVAASEDTICIGGTVSLSKIGGTLGTNTQWKWYSGSCGGTLIDSGTVISVSPAATTTYFVRAEGNCNTTLCRSITITVISTAPPKPVAKDTTVCFGSPVPNLTATGSNIKWYADAGLTNFIASGNSFATGQTDAGIYNYFVTQTINNCESAADTATLTINPKPFVTAFASPSNINAGDTSILMAFNAVNYSWTPTATLSSSTGATVSAFPDTTTTYTITGTDANGCTNTATVTVTVGFTGIASAAVDKRISVYPNPTDALLNIKIENSKLQIANCELKIYDVLGKEVYFSKLPTPDTELNLAKYADGMYFLQIKTDSEQQWFKVVVEK